MRKEIKPIPTFTYYDFLQYVYLLHNRFAKLTSRKLILKVKACHILCDMKWVKSLCIFVKLRFWI